MKTMALRSWKLFTVLLAVVAVTACDDDDDNGDIDLDRMTSAEFVQQAAASDMFEITTGQLAMDMSENQEVMDFGEMLVDDHTTSSNLLMQLAQQKSIAMPTTLPQDKQAIVDRLEGETGEEFDQDFASVQVQAHEQAIALYEEAIDELEDADLRAFAQNILPVLEMHLQHAEELRDNMDGE